MKPNSAQRPVLIEFQEHSVHLLEEDRGLVLTCEREPGGALTQSSIGALGAALRNFLQPSAGALRPALCALPARGVSVREISLPASQGENLAQLTQLVALQVEMQFPVPPHELAWGFLPSPGGARAGENGRTLRTFLVAGVRAEFLESYRRVLAAAGLEGRFTVGAIARCWAHGQAGLCNTLEVGAAKSELLSVGSTAAPLRILTWGTRQLPEVEGLRQALGGAVGRVQLSGPSAVLSEVARGLGARPDRPVVCEVVPGLEAPGRTAATLGLRRMAEARVQPLLLETQHSAVAAAPPRQGVNWAVLAGLLLVACLFLRYAEGLLFTPGLSARVAGLRQYRATLPPVERELNFLQYLKTNQPPYLDAIAVIAQAAPPGTKLDALALARRGDISIKGVTMGNPQAPETFRSKLIESGFFSKVVVEEQSPNPQDQQRLAFRIVAQLRPGETRRALPPEKPVPGKPGQPGLEPGVPFTPGDTGPFRPPGGMPPEFLRRGIPPGAMPMPH